MVQPAVAWCAQTCEASSPKPKTRRALSFCESWSAVGHLAVQLVPFSILWLWVCSKDSCVVVPILAREAVVTDLPVVVHRKPWVCVTFIFGLPALRDHHSNKKIFFFFSCRLRGAQSGCTLSFCCVINCCFFLEWSSNETCVMKASFAVCSVESHVDRLVY